MPIFTHIEEDTDQYKWGDGSENASGDRKSRQKLVENAADCEPKLLWRKSKLRYD